MKNPLISVIIPVFNGEKYLSEAIDSVLIQNYQNLELIIIDDGSVDDTREVLKHLIENKTIQYIYQENRGESAARNLGVRLAKGD